MDGSSKQGGLELSSLHCFGEWKRKRAGFIEGSGVTRVFKCPGQYLRKGLIRGKEEKRGTVGQSLSSPKTRGETPYWGKMGYRESRR